MLDCLRLLLLMLRLHKSPQESLTSALEILVTINCLGASR
jgi:hypothetical protein